MATIRKTGRGKWQAQVARKGLRRSKVFATKLEAKDWAARQEHLILSGSETGPSKWTFGDLLLRYGRDVSTGKRGARWEIMRINKICCGDIAVLLLSDLTPEHLARWRDMRLGEVSPTSVKREMQLMSSALNVARREWGWISTNPISEVRKPPSAPPRDRLVSQDEIERIVLAGGPDLTKIPGRVAVAFQFAIETAMRAGEITGLIWQNVDSISRVALLPLTKNGTSRKVALSNRAIALLERLPRTQETCFGLSARQLDTGFRRIRDRAGVTGLHFHDTRHEAITRLARKMDVLSLARMVGHRDIRMLQVYYNETAEEIARRLD